MSSVVDASGNRIITDILVQGYIKQHIETKLNLSIPLEIKHLCFKYWFINICDFWTKQFCLEEYIQINEYGDCVKSITKNWSGSTVYGTNIIKPDTFLYRIELSGEAGS